MPRIFHSNPLFKFTMTTVISEGDGEAPNDLQSCHTFDPKTVQSQQMTSCEDTIDLTKL